MNLLSFLTDVEHECKVKSVLHSESAKYYNRINILFCCPALSITALCGSTFLSGNNFFSIFPDVSKVLAILNMMACIVLVTQNLINFTKIAGSHIQISREYSKLYREIIYFKKQSVLHPYNNFLEVFCNNIHFKLNIITEVELSCPDSIMKSILNEKEELLTEKYFIAQTKFKKYKYSKKHIKKIYTLNRSQLMELVVAELRKDENRHRYPYMNFFDASLMQIIDFIIVELNVDPKNISEINSDESLIQNQLPIIRIIQESESHEENNIHATNDFDTPYGTISASSAKQLKMNNTKYTHKKTDSDVSEFGGLSTGIGEDVTKSSDIASTISDTESYRNFKEDLERNILRYYKKFKKRCYKCGMEC